GAGCVDLEFVNETKFLGRFEVRVDGEVMTSGTAHPAVVGDYINDGVCVDGRAAPVCGSGPVGERFRAATTVEVRLALGGERNWDFDWVIFYPLPDASSKADCRDDFEYYGFKTRAQCIRYVETGKDSR
ncbi:MAG TPA: hypothetical protein VLB85_05400, partial [Acidimicrobiia bacterium]|nr:hypothetical protein [Acidimicrobiia bacterium]